MEDKSAMREAHREENLEVINNPNVVRFREVYVTNNNKLCINMYYAY